MSCSAPIFAPSNRPASGRRNPHRHLRHLGRRTHPLRPGGHAPVRTPAQPGARIHRCLRISTFPASSPGSPTPSQKAPVLAVAVNSAHIPAPSHPSPPCPAHPEPCPVRTRCRISTMSELVKGGMYGEYPAVFRISTAARHAAISPAVERPERGGRLEQTSTRSALAIRPGRSRTGRSPASARTRLRAGIPVRKTASATAAAVRSRSRPKGPPGGHQAGPERRDSGAGAAR